MALAQRLEDRYGLDFCEVSLVDPTSEDPALGIAEVAATEMEKHLKSEKPIVMALGTGREIRGAVDQVSRMNCPHHKIVSLVGSLAPDGSANVNDPITVIGDATRAPRHPLAVPLLATSKEERDIICAQKPIRRNIALAQSADVAFVGIGELNDVPPLLTDGFITQRELRDLIAAGGAGEIVGWAYDDQGALISGQTNDRVASVPLRQPAVRPIIGVARGSNKVRAIRGALEGRRITCLITDETRAATLLG
jgi:DNA-binding transcriptional regulator LsrR (DeoR family)